MTSRNDKWHISRERDRWLVERRLGADGEVRSRTEHETVQDAISALAALIFAEAQGDFVDALQAFKELDTLDEADPNDYSKDWGKGGQPVGDWIGGGRIREIGEKSD